MKIDKPVKPKNKKAIKPKINHRRGGVPSLRREKTKSRGVKKTTMLQVSQPLVPMIAPVVAEVKKNVNKLFPKPLEFEFTLALLLLVITEMSLIIMQ